MSNSATSTQVSPFRQQMLRSLRVYELAREAYEADRQHGFFPGLGDFKHAPGHVREAYFAGAEGELASPPPIAPVARDVEIGRDQVQRAQRAKVLNFGGSRV